MRLLKHSLLVLLIACSALSPLQAALSSSSVWEVRTTGANTNGGGFVTGSSGADYSVNDNKNASGCTSCGSSSANLSVTDGVSAGTTTLTSVTATFSSAIVGNIIYVSGGTGSITAAWYQVTTFTNSTTVVVDRSTGLTAGTGVTINIGGALADMVTPPVAAGHIVYVKATATYSVGATQTFAASGSGASAIYWVGYTSTRTDAGQPTLQATAGSVSIVSITGTVNILKNFILDCNSQTSSVGFNTTAGVTLQKLKAMNCATAGFQTSNGLTGINLWAANNTGTGLLSTASVSTATQLVDAYVTGGSAAGFSFAGTNLLCVRCVAAANSGATSDGFISTGTSAVITVVSSAFYNNGRDGLRLSGTGSGARTVVRDSVFVSNAGFGLNSASDAEAKFPTPINFNAYYNNTSGALNNYTAGASDVTMTADPFTNGASLDFSLNNTAGGGALLKGTGFPGTALTGGTGYIDIGPIQHQGSGGGQQNTAYVQ